MNLSFMEQRNGLRAFAFRRLSLFTLPVITQTFEAHGAWCARQEGERGCPASFHFAGMLPGPALPVACRSFLTEGGWGWGLTVQTAAGSLSLSLTL